MVIYVDILIFINTVVNFILITLTSKLTGYNIRLFKKILSALISALFSLYIFLPTQNILIDVLVRLTCSFLTVIIAFGFGNLKKYLINTSMFFVVSFIFAGLMAGIYMLFTPNGMTVAGGIVYFDISPLVLITASLIYYVLSLVIKYITKRSCNNATRCEVTLYTNSEKQKTTVMFDTGHSIKDTYGDSEVLIIDRDLAVKLFGANDTIEMLSLKAPQNTDNYMGFRLVPIDTVSGSKLLPAVKLKKAEFFHNNKIKTILSPLAVISDCILGEDYSCISAPINFE
jgi:stage II sporulation protein GA (sporulation sigma-E factor processing peptidase)